MYCFLTACIAALAGTASAEEIHQAVKQADLAALKRIIQGNPSAVNEVEVHGWTALHMVPANLRYYKSKAIAVTTFLIESGADANAVDADGDTPLHEAVGQGLPDIAKLLLDNGAELETANDTFGWIPLHRVAADGFNEGHAKAARLLLQRGANMNARAKDGKTPLELARHSRRQQMVDVLQQWSRR